MIKVNQLSYSISQTSKFIFKKESTKNSDSLKRSFNLNKSTQQKKRTISPLLVHERQRNNPLMKHIMNVKYKITRDIIPDFVISTDICIYFVSLRYHSSKPQYILNRLSSIPNCYKLRVLLVFVDTDQYNGPLQDLNILCIKKNMTLVLAWSNFECARYIETYKAYEHKTSENIQEKSKTDYSSQLNECLTTIRHISSTNVKNLSKSLGSLSNIFRSSIDQLSRVPGLGEKKSKRLYQVFNSPFVSSPMKRKKTTSKSNDMPNMLNFVKRIKFDEE